MFSSVATLNRNSYKKASVFVRFFISKALRLVLVTPPEIIGEIYRVTTEQLRTGGYPLSSLLNKGIADATKVGSCKMGTVQNCCDGTKKGQFWGHFFN